MEKLIKTHKHCNSELVALVLSACLIRGIGSPHVRKAVDAVTAVALASPNMVLFTVCFTIILVMLMVSNIVSYRLICSYQFYSTACKKRKVIMGNLQYFKVYLNLRYCKK